MTDENIKILEHFITRTSMHIVPINELSIVSWIHGFEEGSNTNRFTDTLKKYIEVTYDLYGSNLGWPRHIKLYSEKINTNWNKAFFEIATIIIEKLKNT